MTVSADTVVEYGNSSGVMLDRFDWYLQHPQRIAPLFLMVEAEERRMNEQ